MYASFIIRPEFKEADFAALRQYCQRLGLNFASFAMLIPLPGTDLYEEVKDQLITHNFDYFDFIHTQLPTVLPLKEFYTEYQRLYTTGISLSKQLSILKKFPLRELPHTLMKGQRFYNRIKMAYLDYES